MPDTELDRQATPIHQYEAMCCELHLACASQKATGDGRVKNRNIALCAYCVDCASQCF